MKIMKGLLAALLLATVSNSYSWQQGGYGWDCFHNGVFYAMVGRNMLCPDPDVVLNNNGAVTLNRFNGFGAEDNNYNGSLLKHDPNDHTCVITRVASSNH